MVDAKQPQIGQIVKIIRGRDRSHYAVIINQIDERYVLIADGDKRKFDQPKRKNLLHLELQNVVGQEIVESIKETGRVTNGKLRYALNKFSESQQLNAQMKGE